MIVITYDLADRQHSLSDFWNCFNGSHYNLSNAVRLTLGREAGLAARKAGAIGRERCEFMTIPVFI